MIINTRRGDVGGGRIGERAKKNNGKGEVRGGGKRANRNKGRGGKDAHWDYKLIFMGL